MSKQPRSVVLITEESPNFRHVFCQRWIEGLTFCGFKLREMNVTIPLFQVEPQEMIVHYICLAFFLYSQGEEKNCSVLSHPQTKHALVCDNLIITTDFFN